MSKSPSTAWRVALRWLLRTGLAALLLAAAYQALAAVYLASFEHGIGCTTTIVAPVLGRAGFWVVYGLLGAKWVAVVLVLGAVAVRRLPAVDSPSVLGLGQVAGYLGSWRGVRLALLLLVAQVTAIKYGLLGFSDGCEGYPLPWWA
jgi:hypothetical protein